MNILRQQEKVRQVKDASLYFSCRGASQMKKKAEERRVVASHDSLMHFL
jgi:hypothetical protein